MSFALKGSEGFDLSSFREKKIIPLKGKWHFIWKKYISPQDIIEKGIPSEAILRPVPGRWLYYKKKYPPTGYATYITTLINPPSYTNMLIKLERVASSYKVYFIQKGKIIETIKNGVIGKTKEESVPGGRFFFKNIFSRSGDITVLFHLSSFHYRSGGFFTPPEVGDEFYMRKISKQSFVVKILISGILLMMTMYHFALYILRRSDKTSLIFGGFCFLLFIRGAVTEGFIESFFEMTTTLYSFQKTIEFICFSWSSALLLTFMRSVLGKHFAPKTHKLACTIGIIFTTFVLLTTTEIYSNKMGLQIVQGLFACIAISVLVQLGIATKRKEKYASIIFYPLIFAIITLVYEIVAINLNLYFRHASSFGFSIYVFSQSYILAKKFNKAYTTAERLSEHLKEEVDIQTKEAVEQKNRALVSEKNVSGLLNNMKQAVFAMGEKGTIVPPVSRYTEHIFEGDIVGKNIFDVLYKNIGEESELYSSIKFLIDVCINEDSLQYDTMNDALPREVKRLNHEKKERTLKINYSPLFDSNDICRKIMLVIEDITEVLELEQEVVQEKEKATLKIQRLQEIVSNSKREIKVFFREVSLQLDVAKRSVNELDREEYCRAMHTVKGSARIYNLSSFSEEIHLLENKVEDFKNNNDQKNKMSENYNGLELLINQYLDLFKEVFGHDVDETMMKIEDEFVEVPKDIFFSTMEKTKSLLKKEGLFAIIEELKKIEFDDLKKTLFGLHNSLNNMAQSLNKKINLNISGDEVYLNKKTSLMIKDSLMHIIQNSADHGIEAEGHIKIMIKKIEDDIHLEVSDNGKGIDAEDIHKKALEKGLVKKSTSEHFTKSDKLNLIMLAGFSTKQMATEYSGRGVGMDVVKTNIEKLGGTINIDSTLGEGTLFKIQIPYPEEDSSSPDKEVA